MNRKQKNLKLKVLFNASVVLSGLRSKKGGSGKLLELARIGKIDGIISEIVFDEVLKHSGRLGFTTATAVVKNIQIFKEILPAPDESLRKLYISGSPSRGWVGFNAQVFRGVFRCEVLSR